MARKCPPGVFCIENTTILFLIFMMSIFLIILSIILPNYLKNIQHYTIFPNGTRISNHTGDILSNPYLPPHRDGNYFPKDSGDPRGIPINVPTRGPRTNWKQIGILTRLNGEETILPLMGRPMHTNRQKWQFYTLSDKNNSVKLPISKNGKSCTADYGCDELFNGDSVFVEGYNDAFKATIYENNTPEYIPFI